MSQDNLLEDLEGLVDCDWLEVHKEFKREERLQEMSEPVIPDFPNFDDFYNIMLDLSQDQFLSPILAELVHKFLRNQGRRRPSAFDKVWSFFTDPHRYGTCEIECGNCRSPYTVIYEQSVLPRFTREMWTEIDEHQMTVKQEEVNCPNCGCGMLRLTAKPVGVIDNRRQDEFKFKSRNNF